MINYKQESLPSLTCTVSYFESYHVGYDKYDFFWPECYWFVIVFDVIDISKVFDKVWHESLLYRLKQNGISRNILNIASDFLCQRNQRIVLNGQHSL